ncbi:hypothetical protein AAY473_013763, partial [Plecturocebus cupreus]
MAPKIILFQLVAVGAAAVVSSAAASQISDSGGHPDPSSSSDSGRVDVVLPPLPRPSSRPPRTRGLDVLWEATVGRTRSQEIKTMVANMHLGRPRQDDCLRTGVEDQPEQHSEILSLQKIKLAKPEAMVVDHLRSGVRDHTGQHGETLSLIKMQKFAGHG